MTRALEAAKLVLFRDDLEAARLAVEKYRRNAGKIEEQMTSSFERSLWSADVEMRLMEAIDPEKAAALRAYVQRASEL